MNRDLKIGLGIVIPILAICAVFPPLRGIFFMFLFVSLISLFGWGCYVLLRGAVEFISNVMDKREEEKDKE